MIPVPPTCDTYTIGTTSVTDNSTFGGVVFDGTLEAISVIGSQGANTFNVTPNAAATISVDGQNPTVPTGDVLSIDFTSTKGAKLTPSGPNGGTISFTTGGKPITYANIETAPDVVALTAQQQSQQQAAASADLLSELANDPLLVGSSDTGKGSAPLVKIYDVAQNNAVLLSFYAYQTTFTGGVRTALADVTGDGVPDIITAPGLGRIGEIKVFDGAALAAGASSTGQHLVGNPDAALVSSGTALNVVLNNTATATFGLVGQLVSAPNIPLGTVVTTIPSATKLTLSASATTTATVTATIGPAVLSLKTVKNSTVATVVKVVSINGMVVGQSIFGATTVSMTTSIGSKTATVSSAAGLVIGEPVTGPNLIAGTIISGISGTTLTLSTAATASGAMTAVFDPIAANTTISALKFGTSGVILTLSAAAKGTGTNPIYAAAFLPEGTTYTEACTLQPGMSTAMERLIS